MGILDESQSLMIKFDGRLTIRHDTEGAWRALKQFFGLRVRHSQDLAP